MCIKTNKKTQETDDDKQENLGNNDNGNGNGNGNNEDANILTKEIGSWSKFEYSLREEDRLLFNKMFFECTKKEDYIKAASSKDDFFSAESLFMILILRQQKLINELIAKVAEWKSAKK